jgi:adenylate cyclase
MGVDKGIFFKKVHRTRVIPVSLKITIMFIIFILASNFASNYVNLMSGRSIQFKLMKELLAKDLKEIYSFANTQYEIYQFNRDKHGTLGNIADKATYDLKNSKAIMLGVAKDGIVITYAPKASTLKFDIDQKSLAKMNENLEKGKGEDFLIAEIGGEDYFGVYKYNERWGMYIFRAEEVNEFYKESREKFLWIVGFIILITLFSTIAGVLALRYLLRYIEIISSSIMQMIKNQQMQLINLRKAPNDDITYMGIAFNSLSSTIDTLMNIFRKFANKDVVIKAYKDKEILLEGNKRELTILFSDIKGFTFITETLGTDIIKLINMHYDQSIREIVNHDGVIGSIIGDALLAVFGTMEEVSEYNKSYASVLSAYKLHDVAQSLRDQMTRKRNDILKKRKKLTDDEERVYQAVLFQIGVGIDGGEVFYGNIGSYVRMTNTVIGDTVNSASRLEGLTRLYKVPVICSDFVKEDIEKNIKSHNITFFEIDQVQVKGKTEGKRIYWPVKNEDLTPKLKKSILLFSAALMEYYDGNWRKARSLFTKCDLPVAEVFSERTKQTCPKNWKGVWAMTTK